MSLSLVQFVLISDLFDFQEKSSGFDRKDKFKGGVTRKIRGQTNSKEAKEEVGSRAWLCSTTHNGAVVAERQHGQPSTMHGSAWAPAMPHGWLCCRARPCATAFPC